MASTKTERKTMPATVYTKHAHFWTHIITASIQYRGAQIIASTSIEQLYY